MFVSTWVSAGRVIAWCIQERFLLDWGTLLSLLRLDRVGVGSGDSSLESQ